MPIDLIIYDELDECSYLPGRVSRLPLRLPPRRLLPGETDARWAQGDRRHGYFLYRTACPDCRACQPIRLDVHTFRPSATQRRVKNRGDRQLVTRVGKPTVDVDRLALYERHKQGRGLRVTGEGAIEEGAYRAFFLDECVESVELSYFLDGRLVGIAICDRGATSLSAVYAFYDPEVPGLSIGTYSVCKQVELARQWGLRHLYLGFFIAENPHMRYKASYRPHERLIDGTWRGFDR